MNADDFANALLAGQYAALCVYATCVCILVCWYAGLILAVGQSAMARMTNIPTQEEEFCTDPTTSGLGCMGGDT